MAGQRGRPKKPAEEKAENRRIRRRIKKSPLRLTQKELQRLEPTAFANIERSIKGEEVASDVVSTSRWVINTLLSVGKAATAEEITLNDVKVKMHEAYKRGDEVDDIDYEEEDEDTPTTRFSLHVLPTKKDLE